MLLVSIRVRFAPAIARAETEGDQALGAALRPDDAGVACVIDSLYEAAFDDDAWEHALAGFSEITGSESALLFVTHAAGEVGSLAATCRVTPDIWDEYGALHAASDPRRRYVTSNPLMHVAYDYRHTAEADMNSDPLYQWLKSYGLRYYMGSMLTRDGGACHIRVQRTPRQGHVNEEEIALFSALLPHAARAVQLRQRIARRDAAGMSGGAAMDQLDFGIFLLDAAGRVVHANAMASIIEARADGVTSTKEGVRALAPEDNRRLQKLIGGALGNAAIHEARLAGGQCTVRRDEARPYHVQVMPLKGAASPFGQCPPAAVVFVTDPDNRTLAGADQLRLLFGLTPAEARLATHLAQGASLASYAAAAGLKEETARGYTKRIYAKVGAHTRADMVSVLRRCAPPVLGVADES